MPKVGGFKTPEGWGPRSALGGTFKALLDHRGNQDGLWDNEDKMAGTTGGFVSRQPLALRGKAAVSVGFKTSDEIAALTKFVADAEASWKAPTIRPDITPNLRDAQLYTAQKALVMSQFERHPSEVTEHIVHAAGSVDGETIEARNVFTQLWAAQGEPSGRVVVLSPGFQETWRNFVEQINLLNEAGHDVLVMDHQWASQTDGKPGGLDRGFGAARDVAAVTAKAAAIAKERHGENGVVILAGNSMGAGPGVLGAAVMNAAGRIKLDGDPMPTALQVAVSDPFLGATKNFVNDALALASHAPIINTLQLPSAGAPDLTDDPVAEQKGAQDAVLGDVRAQLSTMTKALPDLATVQHLAANTDGIFGRLIVVHATEDPLADPKRAESFVNSIGPQAEMRWVDSKNHVLQQSPTEQHHLVDAINTLAAEAPRAVDSKASAVKRSDIFLEVHEAAKILPDSELADLNQTLGQRYAAWRAVEDRVSERTATVAILADTPEAASSHQRSLIDLTRQASGLKFELDSAFAAVTKRMEQLD